MGDITVNMAVVGPYLNLFTYKLRQADTTALQPGCRFLVPFGKSHKVAFFVENQTEPVDYRLRFAIERIDTLSPFPAYLFEFCRWISNYYYAGLGETLAAALPGTGTKKPKLEFVALNKSFFVSHDVVGKAAEDLASKFATKGFIREDAVRKDKILIPMIKDWLEAGMITPRYRIKTQRHKLIGYRLNPDAPDRLVDPFASGIDDPQPHDSVSRLV